MTTSDASDPGSAAPVLPEGRFEGREAFRQHVRDALACAAHEGWREIILSDADFHDWPLGERAVVDSLNGWAKTGRRLVMLAKSYDEVTRTHPRFVRWRTTWAHIIECRRCAAVDPSSCRVPCGPPAGSCDGWIPNEAPASARGFLRGDWPCGSPSRSGCARVRPAFRPRPSVCEALQSPDIKAGFVSIAKFQVIISG